MVQDAAAQAGPGRPGPGPADLPAARPDSGLGALALVASFHQIPCEPAQVRHDLGLGQAPMSGVDIVRGARRLGLKGLQWPTGLAPAAPPKLVLAAGAAPQG